MNLAACGAARQREDFVMRLAAPSKAPYFEVDFMAPIADRVGGWKGSTIGFCLFLASGTKRLIWTA